MRVAQGAASAVATYSYDAASNLPGYTYPNSVQTTNTFDTLNRLTNLAVAPVSSPATPLVDSIPKAHTWLPDGALASEVQNCGCKQASGAYTALAQDAKIEILTNMSF